MKRTILILALAALASCGGRGQNRTAAVGSASAVAQREQPTTQSEHTAAATSDTGYIRISGATVGSFELRGGTEYHSKIARDAWFSRELLRALDDALTRYDYTVEIRNDTIAAPGRDTLRITRYDFRAAAVTADAAVNAEVSAKLNAAFSDTALVERFIGVLKPPYAAIYFMRGDDLCVVVRQGLPYDTEREMREQFPDYFATAADTPAPRPEELKHYVLH